MRARRVRTVSGQWCPHRVAYASAGEYQATRTKQCSRHVFWRAGCLDFRWSRCSLARDDLNHEVVLATEMQVQHRRVSVAPRRSRGRTQFQPISSQALPQPETARKPAKVCQLSMSSASVSSPASDGGGGEVRYRVRRRLSSVQRPLAAIRDPVRQGACAGSPVQARQCSDRA